MGDELKMALALWISRQWEQAFKMIWGRLRYVKESERILLNNEGDRIVEDERG